MSEETRLQRTYEWVVERATGENNLQELLNRLDEERYEVYQVNENGRVIARRRAPITRELGAG